MKLWTALLAALSLSPLAIATVCPHFVVLSAGEGGLIAPRLETFPPSLNAGDTLAPSPYELSPKDWNFMHALAGHCRWLAYKTNVPEFAEEYDRLCGALEPFERFQNARFNRRGHIAKLKGMRAQAIKDRAAIEAVQADLDIRVNAEVRSAIFDLQQAFPAILEQLDAVRAAWKMMDVEQRSRVQAAFKFVGNWSHFHPDARLEPYLERHVRLRLQYQVMREFRRWTLAIAQGQETDRVALELRNALVRISDYDVSLFDSPGQSGVSREIELVPLAQLVAQSPEVSAARREQIWGQGAPPTGWRYSVPSEILRYAPRQAWLDSVVFSPLRQRERARLDTWVALAKSWQEVAETDLTSASALPDVLALHPQDALEDARSFQDLLAEAEARSQQQLRQRADARAEAQLQRELLEEAHQKAIEQLAELQAKRDRENAVLEQLAPQWLTVIDEWDLELANWQRGLSEEQGHDYSRVLLQNGRMKVLEEALLAFYEGVESLAQSSVEGGALTSAVEDLFVQSLRAVHNPAKSDAAVTLRITGQATRGNALFLSGWLFKAYQNAAERQGFRVTSTQSDGRVREMTLVGRGVAEFFESELGKHDLQAENLEESPVASKKGQVFTSSVDVSLVVAGKVTAPATLTRVYRMKERLVADRRSEEGVHQKIDWDAFFEGEGLDVLSRDFWMHRILKEHYPAALAAAAKPKK